MGLGCLGFKWGRRKGGPWAGLGKAQRAQKPKAPRPLESPSTLNSGFQASFRVPFFVAGGSLFC